MLYINILGVFNVRGCGGLILGDGIKIVAPGLSSLDLDMSYSLNSLRGGGIRRLHRGVIKCDTGSLDPKP